jgi:hypothetical protein
MSFSGSVSHDQVGVHFLDLVLPEFEDLLVECLVHFLRVALHHVDLAVWGDELVDIPGD